MPYIGRSLGDGVRARYIYAATSGQTTFSGNDANGIALAYSDTLYMDVYQNGVLLKPVTDYASTTGTSVVLVTGASTDDVVEMIVYDSFAVADTVSAANGGTFSGTVSMSDDLNVDSGTLFVDASTNRVGVGTAVPNNPLEISHTGDAAAGGLRIGDPSTISSDTGIYLRTTGDAVIGAAGGNIVFDSNMTVQEDMRITSDGEVTKPRQPAFMASPSGTQSNMADATTILLATEIYDVGSNFASNTFTAPVTGKYQLNASIRLQSVDTDSSYVYLEIATSNRSYYNVLDVNFSADLSYLNLSISTVADMDASDTAVMKFGYAGGAQQVDTSGAGGTVFSGVLIC